MMPHDGQQPIYILKEGTERVKGSQAQINNIAAAKAVAEAVRTTLGPMGMDKMLVDGGGSVVITNDGATILRQVAIEHPAAKLIIEVAKTQEQHCYDGTTSAVVIAGALLESAQGLLDQQIHPTVICRGYRKAADLVAEEIKGYGWEADEKDLKEVAKTALTGKSAEAAGEVISEMCVQALDAVKEGDKVELDNIKVLSFEGGTHGESKLIEGVLIEKERLHTEMPTDLTDASVLLLTTAIEMKESKMEARLNITDPAQIQEFLAIEEAAIKEMVGMIAMHGVNVVFCQKEIDDLAVHYLAKMGILAVKRVKKSDLEALRRVTGASLVSNPENITDSDLGIATTIEEEKFGEHRCITVHTESAKSVTAILRGSTGHSVEEVERAFDDAMGVVALAHTHKTLLPGGGAVHGYLARMLREEGLQVGDRIGMAMEAYATALEAIPRTLAENAGLDPVDAIIALRQAKDYCHGITIDGDVKDMAKEGVMEPRKVLSNAIASATEACVMVLRIDDVISMKGGGGPDTEMFG